MILYHIPCYNFNLHYNFIFLFIIPCYRWVLKSLEEMCPDRKLSSIQCIFGDGLIDDSIKIGKYLQAIILDDSFHLFIATNSVWSIDFRHNFPYIQMYLKVMLYAKNEEEFDTAFDAAYRALRGKNDHMQYLEKIVTIGIDFRNILLIK